MLSYNCENDKNTLIIVNEVINTLVLRKRNSENLSIIKIIKYGNFKTIFKDKASM